jgi:hypothetical protein
MIRQPAQSGTPAPFSARGGPSGRLRFVAHALGAIGSGLTTGLAVTSQDWTVGLIALSLVVGLAASVVLGVVGAAREVA